ncbi:MAG: NADH-quinone oxidoreductase subunit L [Bdellovibrionota bacterium]
MLWLVVLFPLLGAILNGFILPKHNKKQSHLVAVLAMVASFVCALITFVDFMGNGGSSTVLFGFDWIRAGGLNVPFELILDRLSGMMLLVVTGIGTLIHIYAGGYMADEKTTYRFFSYLNLFVFMMLLLVLGNNLLVMFVGWEGVGLCSYLLIGYWFEKDENAAAGMKAFLVNRIGDIGFLLGIFLTFKLFGTLSFTELRDAVVDVNSFDPMVLGGIGLITFCLFIGACGKSAQIPLYVWLPDAMAGPTPVSALIHAATMVTAGIYMMTRLNFFYYLAPDTQTLVAIVGAATALFAATIAVVQSDIKKVLAYSTVSQLGYMVLACGVGAYDAGVFHLLTHACFKALLFLGAGSVIVAMHHKQDMFEMGGLKKYMPKTHFVMLVGVLAIIGFPGFSGFFSKDEILWKAFIGDSSHLLWGVGVLAAAFTSFYMVRLLCLTFYGENRSDKHTRDHLHETPAHMWGPLMVLAILSVGIGFIGVPALIGHSIGLENIFEHYLEPIITIPIQAVDNWAYLEAEYDHGLEWLVMGASVVIVFFSAGLAIYLYGSGPKPVTVAMMNRFNRSYNTLLNKYWIDELYFKYFVNPLKQMSLFFYKIIDVKIVDGIVNGIGQAFLMIGGITSFKMSGNLQRHAMVAVIGLFCLLTALAL